MGYYHAADAKGNEVIPDLAAEDPEISEDGLTYTFTIRDGVKFGPPLSRQVTSADVEYAFRRIGTPSLVAQYGFYYLPVIKGLQAYSDAGGLSKPANADAPIEGIETPDDKTIIFHLEQPTGDFLYRLAMPAAGPIPEEVAKCFLKAGEYGPFMISSGPYQVEGSADLDITSCDTMKALAGFDPNKFLKLERNPDYDASTDTPEARQNFFDNWEMTPEHERSGHLRQDGRRPDRPRIRERARRGHSPVHDQSGHRAPLQDQLGRPDVVHHHEPDAAAVRRHPRAEGSELDHGQGRPPPRLGR